MSRISIAYQPFYEAMWNAVGTLELMDLLDRYQCEQVKLLVCFDGKDVCQEDNDNTNYNRLTAREKVVYRMIQARAQGLFKEFDPHYLAYLLVAYGEVFV